MRIWIPTSAIYFIVLLVSVSAVAWFAWQQYTNERVTVVMANPTGGTATLWSYTPDGTEVDGSQHWDQLQACVAQPHGTCSVGLYDHRGVNISVSTQYIFLGRVATQPVLIPQMNSTITAPHAEADANCCYSASGSR